MINKFEAVGIFTSIGLMTLALFLLRVETNVGTIDNQSSQSQTASVAVVAQTGNNKNEALYKTLSDSVDAKGQIQKLVVDDIVIGNGREVVLGDTLTLDYIGTLETGQQFDNSKLRGEPFTFTIGKGQVIKGWEEGLIGMKVGGQRILVIPPEMAYGNREVGPIPAGATLIFSIELLEIQ